MKSIMTLAMLTLSAAAAQAQDELRLSADLWKDPSPVVPKSGPTLPWENQDEFDRGRGRRSDTDLIVNAAIHGHYSMPFGSADRDSVAYSNPAGGVTVLIDQHVSWNDLFHPGWGFDLEFDLMFGDGNKGGRSRTPGFDYGAFVAYMSDTYSGGSVTDDFNASVRASNLDATTLLVGGKVIQSFQDGFFADGRFGIGAVHYSAVQGEFSGPLIPTFRDTLLKETWTFAMDLRGHGGIRLGPVGLTLGMGFRFMAPPTEGGRISLDSGPFWTWDIDLGAEIGF